MILFLSTILLGVSTFFLGYAITKYYYKKIILLLLLEQEQEMKKLKKKYSSGIGNLQMEED